MILCVVTVAVVAGVSFAVGHAGPNSKLKAIQDEVEKVEGAVSGAGQRLVDKIKKIL